MLIHFVHIFDPIPNYIGSNSQLYLLQSSMIFAPILNDTCSNSALVCCNPPLYLFQLCNTCAPIIVPILHYICFNSQLWLLQICIIFVAILNHICSNSHSQLLQISILFAPILNETCSNSALVC